MLTTSAPVEMTVGELASVLMRPKAAYNPSHKRHSLWWPSGDIRHDCCKVLQQERKCDMAVFSRCRYLQQSPRWWKWAETFCLLFLRQKK